jgi:hypothetical protein
MSGAARYDTPKTESYVVRQVGFAWCVDRLTEWSENGRWIETRAQVAEFKNHDLAIHSAREFAERLNRGSR